jgi:hypothetical protein
VDKNDLITTHEASVNAETETVQLIAVIQTDALCCVRMSYCNPVADIICATVKKNVVFQLPWWSLIMHRSEQNILYTSGFGCVRLATTQIKTIRDY